MFYGKDNLFSAMFINYAVLFLIPPPQTQHALRHKFYGGARAVYLFCVYITPDSCR